MTRKNDDKTSRSRCDLVANPEKRRAANVLAASVKDSLPLGLSQPALRALAGAGYSRLEQFTKVSEAELSKLHGMGPKAIEILRVALKAKAKSFRQSSSSD